MSQLWDKAKAWAFGFVMDDKVRTAALIGVIVLSLAVIILW